MCNVTHHEAPDARRHLVGKKRQSELMLIRKSKNTDCASRVIALILQQF